MLKYIDRLAKWWIRRRGITTITVHGGIVTIKDGVIDELNQTGGTVCFDSRYGVTSPIVTSGTAQWQPSFFPKDQGESPAPQS